MTITLDLPTQRRLEALAKKQGRPTEEVAAAIVATSLRHSPAPDRESTLVQRINNGLPEEFWTRKGALDTKAESFVLTDEEQEERRMLLTQMERWQVDRLEAVVELAELRQETPQQVMQQLGILPT